MSEPEPCPIDGCDRDVQARGLCRRCYKRSWDRMKRAAVDADAWDWIAGAAPNFTKSRRGGRGGVPAPPPPTEHPGETETRPVLPDLAIAIRTALAQLPHEVQISWRAASIRLLADTLEDARYAEGTQPSASGIRELWTRMAALEEAYVEQEQDAIDELGALLLAELAPPEGP